MTVDLGNVIDIVINEISHPRPLTIIVLVVGFLLIVAGVQSSMNRRRWASHMALIESMNMDADDVEDNDEIDEELDETISSSEQFSDPNRYDDDDIELI